jgi:hypothetical protein
MRCRKVRSCLSAYCKDELAGKQRETVQNHLTECSACRNEEEFARAMHAKATEIKGPALSTDFNTKLLNRIGQERFGETRTRAYLPKKAPLLMWRRVVPVLATVSVALFAMVSMISGGFGGNSGFMTGSLFGFGTDSYLTAQPSHNHGYAAQLRRDWSLKSQMEQTARINRLSGQLVNYGGFVAESGCPSGCLDAYVSQGPGGTVVVFKMRPLLRVYEPNVVPRDMGAGSIY